MTTTQSTQSTDKTGQRYQKEAAIIRVIGNDGKAHAHWLSADITLDLENIARVATIPIALVPGYPPDIHRQDEVGVKVGDTTLVTGFVLATGAFYKYNDCGLKIAIRDRTGDLIKSSALHKGGQWRNVKMDVIATDLIKPYGLKLRVLDDVGAALKEFKLEHGESVHDALSRLAKKRGLIVTSNAQGELVLCKAGKTKATGAIVRGQNVIEAEDIGTDEDRCSEYIAYGQSEVADDFDSCKQKKAHAVDKEIKRKLPMIINADGKVSQADLQQLVDHQMRVRRGHAYGIQYKIEGWTTLGAAWDINQRIPIYDDIMGLHGEEWLIVKIQYTVDINDGDVRNITVRPVEAYEPEPEIERHKSGKAKRGAKDSAGKAKGKDGAPLTKHIHS